MSSKLTPTALPLAPEKYDYDYMNRLIRQINFAFIKLEATVPITCGSDLSGEAGFPISGLSIVNVPTSSNNLPDWSVWCDTAAGNVLKIKIPTP
jgi:hypothetical protein